MRHLILMILHLEKGLTYIFNLLEKNLFDLIWYFAKYCSQMLRLELKKCFINSILFQVKQKICIFMDFWIVDFEIFYSKQNNLYLHLHFFVDLYFI